MAKFLRIGVHQSNVSGYTSKAWCIRRAGSTIHLKWGAVEVQGAGAGRKVYWTFPPQEKTARCRTVQRAQDYIVRYVMLDINRTAVPSLTGEDELLETAPDQRTVRRIGKGPEAGSYVCSAADVTTFATYGNTIAVAKSTVAYIRDLKGQAVKADGGS